MKLTIISDTHGQHEKLGSLSGDVLIHCGDMFNLFEPNEDVFSQMDDWFGKQDFDLILCTGGNHDLELENRLFHTKQPFNNAVYLQDASYDFNGVTFFGSPWIPFLQDHAFFAPESELQRRWANIPSNIDVLITHTPPRGILDESSQGMVLGCDYLLDAIERVQPKVHCFGHVHESSGQLQKGDTTFINASQYNHNADMTPFEFEL